MSANLLFLTYSHLDRQYWSWRRTSLRARRGLFLLWLLPLCIVALFTPGAAVADLTLSPVGAPIPGQGPVGLAINETGDRTYAYLADFNGNQVRSYSIDRSTGTLSVVGAVPLPNGPSALAVSGNLLLATTLRGNDVTSYRIDPQSGTLSPVGAVPVGDAPNDVKVIGRNVVVGHAISNDVRLLRIDRTGTLSPVGAVPVGTSPSDRITGVAVFGPIAAAGTFAGDVHWFLSTPWRLSSLGSFFTGGDITDITISNRGTLFVTGGIPGRVTAFEVGRSGIKQVGTLALPGLTSRTLAIARGRRGIFWLLVNEFQGNQTRVIKVQREGDENN